MMNELFSARAPSDPTYLAIRDQDRFDDARSHLHLLWDQFRDHADTHFLEAIGQQFQQRYWEMRLGCAILDLGFVLAPAQPKGPDFDASTPDGDRVYIEAVAVGPGEGPDAVPEPNYGSEEAEVHPTNEIVLRIRSAISAKANQYAAHIGSGVIDKSVPYVIAVNIGGITRAFLDRNPPTITHACLGVGSLMIALDPDGTSEVFCGRHEAIRKASGSDVDTEIFLDPGYSWLSGVLLSDVSVLRHPVGTGDFQFLHNDRPDHAIRRGLLSFGSEHWREGTRIHNRWPEETDA